MQAPWRIELFGGLTLRQQDRVIVRFQSAKTGSILGLLARRARPIPRDSLIDMLWPEADLEAARNRLRVALNSLRRQLEPPEVPSGSVLQANRATVALNPLAFSTDVADFEGALQVERQAEHETERVQALERAVGLYRGELLAGLYDEWVLPERTALAEACLQALRRLTRALAQARRYEEALEYARRAVSMDPLGEPAQRLLIRLYGRIGRPAAAARQYRELSRLLRSELGSRPSAATRRIARKYRHASPEPPPAPAVAAASAPPPAAPEPPAVSTLPRTPDRGGIPVNFSALVGREEVVSRLCERLQAGGGRLLTLTGPGGIGKTRVAAECAWQLRQVWRERAWFVAWPPSGGELELLESLAQSMSIPAGPGPGIAERVLETLRQGPALVVIDDVDSTGDGAALDGLRLRVPHLSMLVTARRRLGLEGEQEQALAPLAVPPGEESLAELARCPSVALFVERAQAVRPDFQVTTGNSEALRRLCQRLEGHPLALELAAAWAPVLTPAQMLERLDDRFSLLVSRRRGREERHRSLWAAIDSSYTLLSPELQNHFCQLSVFRGGFTLEAVESGLGQRSALERLEELTQHALVRVDESEAGMRFALLDSLREYAAGHLDEEHTQVARRRHAAYFQALADLAGPALTGLEAEAWLARLEQEHENLQVALNFQVETGQDGAALALAGRLWRFWLSGGHPAQGVRWLTRILALPGATDAELRLQALEGLGRLQASLGDLPASLAALDEALSLAAGQPEVLLTNAALVATELGDHERAALHYAELAAQQADPWRRARALDAWGRALAAGGQTPEAVAALRESIEVRRELGDRWGCADLFLTLGELEDSAELHAEGLRLFAELADGCALGVTCLNIGALAAEQGDLGVAAPLLAEAAASFRELGDPAYLALGAESLADVTARQGARAQARQLLSEALQLRHDLGDAAGVERIQARLKLMLP